MKVYKLFAYRKNVYWSFSNHGLSICYEEDSENVPEVGYLFAFDTIENALLYAATLLIYTDGGRFLEGFRLCECEGDVVDERNMRIYQYSVKREHMIKFWEQYPNNPACDVYKAPTGTLFCRSVKIEKDITAEIEKRAA